MTTDNNIEPSQTPDTELDSFLASSAMIAVVASGWGWDSLVVLGNGSITVLVDGSTNIENITMLLL